MKIFNKSSIITILLLVLLLAACQSQHTKLKAWIAEGKSNSLLA